MPEMDFERDIQRMQALLNTLKHEYDLYFAGSRRDPPRKEQKELDALVKAYGNTNLPRLAQQFRFTAFSGSYAVLCEQWNKWMRAREDGLVQDPRLLASVRRAKRELQELERGRPLSPASGPEQPPPVPAPARRAPAGDGRHTRALFEEFINAKLREGEVPKWDLASFERHLAQQKAAILQKYKGSDVVFSVQTKDGKVTLKAKVIQ